MILREVGSFEKIHICMQKLCSKMGVIYFCEVKILLQTLLKIIGKWALSCLGEWIYTKNCVKKFIHIVKIKFLQFF